MKFTFLIILFAFALPGFAQIDPSLLRDPKSISDDSLTMNLDAVYDRPFIDAGKLPVSIGGYMEANYQYVGREGVTEGHQFQARRLTLFLASSVAKRMKFLTEIELEEGGKAINIEFASLDFEFSPLLNFRGGIIMNPIGAFNQNHDGPKWEFTDRPLSATAMLPATFSNAGAGLFGKKYSGKWAYAYELYLTNGFDESIIENAENRTFLPAAKQNAERFEESFNGSMLFTGKIAAKHERIGEIGLSYMRGAYNKFEDDGLELDKRRYVKVYAVDVNTTLPTRTSLTGEWAFVHVDLPDNYTEQFGRKQQGGFLDIVQPIIRKPWFGFQNSVLNVSARLEYVDWNIGKFKSTNTDISDHIYSVSAGIGWRPVAGTIFRFNYKYSWQTDLLGNPAVKTGAIQLGIATYF